MAQEHLVAVSPQPPLGQAMAGTAVASTLVLNAASASGISAPLPTAGVDPFFRNDPNNIFYVLQSKMRQLELNQSLIHDWLVVWQAQIGSKLKGLNASTEATSAVVRTIQAGLAVVESEQQVLNNTVAELRAAVSRFEPYLQEHAKRANGPSAESIVALERQVHRLDEAHRKSEIQLRREMASMTYWHRFELACAIILSLGTSLIVFAFCFAHSPPTVSEAHGSPHIAKTTSRSLIPESLSTLFSARPRGPVRRSFSDGGRIQPHPSTMRSSDSESRYFDEAVSGVARGKLGGGGLAARPRIMADLAMGQANQHREADELSASTLSGDEDIKARLAEELPVSDEDDFCLPESADSPDRDDARSGFGSLGVRQDKIPRRHTFPSLLSIQAPPPDENLDLQRCEPKRHE